MPKARAVSPLEVTYVGCDMPNLSIFVNNYFVEGVGDIGKADIEAVLPKVIAANPGFNLRLKGFWGWRYWDSEGCGIEVREMESSWAGDGSLNSPNFHEAMHPRSKPNVQIWILRGAVDGKVRVMFRTHHGVTDGKGTLHLMEETFRALRGEPLLGSICNLHELDVFEHNKPEELHRVQGGCLPPSKVSTDPELQGICWRRVRLDIGTRYLLPKTLLSVAKLAWKHNGPGKVVLRVPSDLRRYLKDQIDRLTIANCSGAMDVEITPEDTAKAIHGRIVKMMKRKLDLAVLPANLKWAAWLPNAIYKIHPDRCGALHTKGLYRHTGTVSFLGQVDIQLYSCSKLKTEAISGVPIPLPNKPIYIGVAHYGGKAEFSIALPTALVSEQQMDEFIQEWQAQLFEIDQEASNAKKRAE